MIRALALVLVVVLSGCGSGDGTGPRVVTMAQADTLAQVRLRAHESGGVWFMAIVPGSIELKGMVDWRASK